MAKRPPTLHSSPPTETSSRPRPLTPRERAARERATRERDAAPRRSSLTGASAGHSVAAAREAEARQSIPAWIALVLAAQICFGAPLVLSGFMPATYDYAPQALWLGELALLAIVLLLAAVRRPAGEGGLLPKQRPSLVGGLLLLFLGWCCASVIGAAYRHDALLEAARLLGVVAWFFLARRLIREVPIAGTLLVASSAIGGAYLASDALTNFLITSYPRQSGGFFNPNLFATWGAMLVPLGLALTVQLALLTRRAFESDAPSGGLWKWGVLLSGLATLVIAGGLAVTSSKGGFLAVLAALLVFGIAVLRARGRQVGQIIRSQARIVLPLVAVLLVLGALVAAKTVLPRLQQARGTDDNSTMFRLYTWRGTWAMTQAKPVLGWGAGTFPSVYPQFAITGDTRSAHESWLQLAAECGVAAPLLLLGAVGAAFARGWRGLKTRDDWPLVAGAFGAIVALVVHGFTDDPWKVIVTAALGTFALAVLDGDKGISVPAPEDNARVEPEIAVRKAHPPFYLVPGAICLMLAAWWTNRSAAAVDLWRQADSQLTLGNSGFAAILAQSATETMPLSARAQIVRGWSLAGNGNVTGAEGAMTTATQLQPTSAVPAYNLASLLARYAPQENAAIQRNFDRAVQLAPQDIHVLLERADWLLEHKDARAWQDYRKIAALSDAPYGRYPALGDDVNLDFDRARLKLAERAPVAQRKNLLARVLANVKRARSEAALLIYKAAEASGKAGEVAKRQREIDDIEQQADALRG